MRKLSKEISNLSKIIRKQENKAREGVRRQNAWKDIDGWRKGKDQNNLGGRMEFDLKGRKRKSVTIL